MRVLGYNQFSRRAIRHSMLLTEFFCEVISFDTQPGLQRIGRIVESGVNDAAIARTGGHPEFGELLYKIHTRPISGESFGDGAADDPASNNQNVGLFHKPKGIPRSKTSKTIH